MDITINNGDYILSETLKEYEAKTDMTNDERLALYDWVSAGYSPYNNPYHMSDENGGPMDFVSAMQLSDEMRIQRYEELNTFDEIKSERNTLRFENKALKTYIMQLQVILEAKQIKYHKLERPDDIPF